MIFLNFLHKTIKNLCKNLKKNHKNLIEIFKKSEKKLGLYKKNHKIFF